MRQIPTFTCDKCGRTKPHMAKIQPVPITKGKKWCQHCWASLIWGKTWAGQCETAEER